MKFKTIVFRFLALVGAITLCLLIIVAARWSANSQNENTGITAPLKEINTIKRYFGEISEQLLVKSEIIQAVRVKVLNETPKSAILKIQYDAISDGLLDDVWVSASMLTDSGLTPSYINQPAKVTSGRGKKAIVKLWIDEEANFEVLASNTIIVSFYKSGGMPFHQAKFKYQRIWCRRTTEMNDLWKNPYPREKGSKYSINGTRTFSRLCLSRTPFKSPIKK